MKLVSSINVSSRNSTHKELMRKHPKNEAGHALTKKQCHEVPRGNEEEIFKVHDVAFEK